MTPLDYAKCCAAQYETLFAALRLKGNGHGDRVQVDRQRPFLKLMPSVKVCTTRDGGVKWFTSPKIENFYRTDLLSAGLNPDAETHQFNGKLDEHHVILSPKCWCVAAMILRLTGQLPERDRRRAARVGAILKARRTRRDKEYGAELAQRQATDAAAALTRAQEAAADQAAGQFVATDAAELIALGSRNQVFRFLGHKYAGYKPELWTPAERGALAALKQNLNPPCPLTPAPLPTSPTCPSSSSPTMATSVTL